MTFKHDFATFQQRLSELVASLDENARAQTAGHPSGARSRLASIYWTLRDLFTRDITREGLKDLLKRDPRDTLRFYTSEIDFKSLRPLPWYKRYPETAWRVFVSTAYRLSPPRRIAFALAILAIVLGGIQSLLLKLQVGDRSTGAVWWLIGIAILILLLLMELRDKLSLKGDLEIAREIQFGLVPSKPFHRNGVSIYSFMRPSNTVGGDYVDIIELDGRCVAAIIGDVAGKGMPAALLMALLQGSLRTLITAGFRGPELIVKLNDYLCESLPTNSLVTLFYGELDTTTGEFHYINAGHNPAFLIRSGPMFEPLRSTAIALGIREEPNFEAADAQLSPGELLLLYTDGITEAFNEADEEYGEGRMVEFLRNHTGLDKEEFIHALIEDVLRFCGDARPGDDMTALLISRHA